MEVIIWQEFSIRNVRYECWIQSSADDILKYFFSFVPANKLEISCILSHKETICMKCQNLFSEKKKKTKNMNCRLRKVNAAYRIVIAHHENMPI